PVAGASQDLRRALDRLVERGRPSLDEGDGPVLDVVVEEPGLAEHAGVLGPGDLVALDGQFHVVANAAAEGAGGVANDLQFTPGHVFSSWQPPRHRQTTWLLP